MRGNMKDVHYVYACEREREQVYRGGKTLERERARYVCMYEGRTYIHTYIHSVLSPHGIQSGGAKFTASAQLVPMLKPAW